MTQQPQQQPPKPTPPSPDPLAAIAVVVGLIWGFSYAAYPRIVGSGEPVQVQEVKGE